ETDKDIVGFLSSFENDRWIFEADLQVDRAHVVMLAEQGIIDKEEAAGILDALDKIEDEGFDSLSRDHEDIHPAIEEKVIEKTTEKVGGRLHTARSRNDEVATCIRIRLREELIKLAKELLNLRRTIAKTAEETHNWLVPGYTHLQRAQPTTLGHYLLAYSEMFNRDFERVLDAYDRVNFNPLGSGAFAGTGFDIDRDRTSELLGFNGPTRNSMDGVASRDFALECVGVAATVATDLSRLCEDLVIWCSREFDFVELDDKYASSSSIMPQKKNPDTVELARGKAGSVHGSLVSLLSINKSLPMSYNRDLQEGTKHVWEAFDTTLSSVRILNGALKTADFNRERMEEAAKEGFTGATELADTMVREHGLPFRTAHRIVGRLAAEHSAEEMDADLVNEVAKKVTDEDLDLDYREVEKALDPRSNVEIRDSFGGPGEIQGAIEDTRSNFDSDEEKLEELTNEIRESEELLEQAIDKVRGH
ncbi:MAG: argininosuccinate lyase, partial [Halobacteria archaeon]|nr:argininosuccinate lyase [Halobacteria archaeon]